MPGGGGSIASFFSYNEAKRWSRYREEFGKGSVEGDLRCLEGNDPFSDHTLHRFESLTCLSVLAPAELTNVLKGNQTIYRGRALNQRVDDGMHILVPGYKLISKGLSGAGS